MENKLPQSEPIELVLTKYTNLPVIHKQISVKWSINDNIGKDSITKQTKIEENSKDLIFDISVSISDSASEIKKSKKYYIFL